MPHPQFAQARRLADRFHLSVQERASLPGGVLSGSALVAAISDLLAETGWYPQDWRPDRSYDGVVIEAVTDGFTLHERREIGVGRYSEVHATHVDTVAEAARICVSSTFGGSIDGLPIDWSA